MVAFLVVALAGLTARADGDLSHFPKWRGVLGRMQEDAFATLSEIHAGNVKQYRQIEDEADEWKTPAEFARDGGGDCEDFAIALYFKAVAMGVAEEDMAIVVGITDKQEVHAVLRWREWYFDHRSTVPLEAARYLEIFRPLYEINRLGWRDLQR